MVHIKKVEIFGFKSFGFKNTIVEFQPGLVSISGPNGSGKSNILDAIIFAMGENRPKTMRVDKLKSLLHDIEGNRRGPKMARCSVHFDNSDRKIPVDSDTVEITREMDEKGENIYYLNKKKTQRNHILDLLDVANAGLNQLNAVQQGTVTRISEFSPEEKREAIENLIGLSYFDEKKNESEKQLQEADRRLEIALARMDEIKKRIDELEEERNLKLRYDFLEKEITRLNAISAANQLKAINVEKSKKEEEFNQLETKIKQFSEERNDIRKHLSLLELEKSKFMEEVNAYNQAKASIDSELSQTMHQYEEINSSVIALKKRLSQIDLRIPEIDEEIKKANQTKNSLSEKINLLNMDLNELQKERKDNDIQIQMLDSQRSILLRKQADAIAKKSEVDKKIKQLTEKLNSAKLQLSTLSSSINDLEKKLESNLNKQNQFSDEISKLKILKQKLAVVKNNHQSTINELKSRIEQLNIKKNKIKHDIDELNLILEKSQKAAAQYETKIKMIKDIMHEDYSISKLKDNAKQLGILGFVYEMMSWDKQYERAIMAAASDWFKAIVVKDFSTLLSLAEYARIKNLPRLKIIPYEAIPKISSDLPSGTDILGPLSNYVTTSPNLSSLKSFLFGNIILTRNKEAAYKLSKDGYKAVTVDGELFEPRSRALVVDINSKISKLTKIISMSSSVDGLQKSIRLLKKYIHKRQESYDKINLTIEKHKDRLSISETGLASVIHRFNDLNERIENIITFQKQLETRIQELRVKKEKLRTESIRNESYISSLQERISIVEQNFANDEHEKISINLSKLNNEKSEIETNLSKIMTQIREKSSELALQSSQEAKELNTIKNLEEEKSNLTHEIDEIVSKIKTLELEKEKHQSVLVKLRQKEQELISTSGDSVSKLKDYDEQLRALNEKDKDLTREINLLERKSDSLSRDLHDLTENGSRLQQVLDMSGVRGEIETYEVDSILQALRNEQKNLTELNAKAPETYKEVSDGYRSMSTRKNSLEEERNSIVKFIEEIEKDKRQTFLDAFDKVDKEIRNAFSKMTGGNAWLELQNEDDIFNSGISYLIQFPNKPKRESTSISGGEKTLAAIVFVLALQKLKPSPFYLFDEVDAHLDAPNSERLSKILEERSQESQFIMVSLKDSVVQKAKLIYGVYPKNGVSQVVTYKDKRLPSMASS